MLFKKIFAAGENPTQEVLCLNKEPLKVGSSSFEKFLSGGFPSCALSQIYGPSGSGKTNICLCTAVETAKLGKKVLYIDTENSFNIERFKQVAGDSMRHDKKSDYLKGGISNIKQGSLIESGKDMQKIYERILIKRISRFGEQRGLLRNMQNILNKDFGLIVVDSFVSLYRLESSGSRERMIELSKELGRQLSILSELAYKFKLGVLITNQVYEPFEEKKARQNFNRKNNTAPVGGDPLVYWSKVIVELEKDFRQGFRVARLVKHPTIADGGILRFRITENGIE